MPPGKNRQTEKEGTGNFADASQFIYPNRSLDTVFESSWGISHLKLSDQNTNVLRDNVFANGFLAFRYHMYTSGDSDGR
jgi:hypothetical protein